MHSAMKSLLSQLDVAIRPPKDSVRFVLQMLMCMPYSPANSGFNPEVKN